MELTNQCRTCHCSKCRWQGTDNCPKQYCWDCDGNRMYAGDFAAKASWCKWYERVVKDDRDCG